MAALSIDPPACSVPAAGGTSTHQVSNTTTDRLAFKVKSSNNNEYRVRPVYGFVEASSSTNVDIIRLNGPAKDDKLVIQWAIVPPEETEPQAPFKAGAQAGEVILQMSAK